MPRPPVKQKAAVIDALRKYGALTSVEVEAVTGIELAKCSHYLQQLVDVDEIATRRRNYTRYPRKDGFMGPRTSHLWALKPECA